MANYTGIDDLPNAQQVRKLIGELEAAKENLRRAQAAIAPRGTSYTLQELLDRR